MEGIPFGASCAGQFAALDWPALALARDPSQSD